MGQDLTNWAIAAMGELLSLRGPDGGWPYRAGAASAIEATSLALLALNGRDAGADILTTAADWLAARQQADGLFTAAPPHEVGSWLTPLAAMAVAGQGRAANAASAAEALLAMSTYTFSQFPPGTYGYDTRLAGWPWSPGAFSFVEPTALTVLFLKQAGYGEHGRVREAVHLLRDRVLAAGGWNYGEPEVLGGRLYPAEAPTALALLALQDEQDATTAAGLGWLRQREGQITSLYSLGWAATALNVLGAISREWQDTVAESWSLLPPQRRDAVGTALCLLALREAEGHPFILV